jgi:signal transduction histidine kinase
MSIAASGLGTDGRRRGDEPRDWLASGGKMGDLILSTDWTKTPLGPIELWPQGLRTTVSLCLASNFPISLVWGPHHVQIYNDGYWPICGEKHPRAMGQDFTECWASAWPVIGEAFARALAGETSFLENQRMFLDRNGYLEETFFTFSFSPIRDEIGIAGLFHPVTETTAQMLSERRTRALRDLAARTGKAQTVEEACTLAAETLADYQLDVPFTLFYLFDEESEDARLIAATGLAKGSAASPAKVAHEAAAKSAWPLAKVASSGQPQHVRRLKKRFGNLCCGEYPESPEQALALPITPPGCRRPVGVLVAGVSSRLALTDTYRAFYDLLAAAVTSEVANARAYQEERMRAQALQALDRAKTQFFSNVSHEFRTPLTLMLGPLEEELAEHENPLPPERRERLATVHRNSLRLLKLVNTLLDFSRVEADRTQASYEPTDLAAHTTELASVFRSAMEKAGLKLVVNCPTLPEPVYVDREMWEKIVLNLLSNALKHTFEGSIGVALRWCGDYVELTVSDTGVGVPATELPHLFERFHRVKGTRSRTYEGTGIGLALVQELTQMHGGTVHVESQEEKGSRFIVTIRTGTAHLPADRLRVVPASAPSTASATAYANESLHWLPNTSEVGSEPLAFGKANSFGMSPEATASGTHRPRIVLADDNADMRSYIKRLLGERYDVVAVTDGWKALEAIRQKSTDLVLSDIMMPSLDGFGLLRELRGSPETRLIPVLFLSARAGQESAVEGLNAGADDYLAKPFSSQELLARVRTHLDLAHVRRAWANELERSSQELESFSYSVSHDLRTPLRAIDGFSKLLLDEHAGQLDEQACSYLRRIRTAAQKMSELINDLVDLSRVSRGALKKEVINLTALAHDVIAELRRKDPERKVAVEVGEGLVATGDPNLLAIALLNLLSNAWKYTAQRAQARIVFGQESLGSEHPFYVRDNGAGFDEAYVNKLFQPFQRLHATREFADGAGIGLAITQRVISRHGGRIWAEGVVNAGATFYFTLGDI